MTIPQGRGFLTSDNPVFWFKSVGIASKGSEISFPISADTALLETWRNDIPDLIYLNAQPIVENQINYRTMSQADRAVYYGKNKLWVLRHINGPQEQVMKKVLRACLTNNYRRKYHSGTSRVLADHNENIEGKCTFYAGIETSIGC